MVLFILFCFLIIPFQLVAALQRAGRMKNIDPALRFRFGVTILFFFTGIGHFIRTEDMAAMMGKGFPQAILAVQVTGILELLAAIGIWLPKIRRMTGRCLILMMILFLPLNIWAAIQHLPFGGHALGPIYLLARVPFQFLLIWWIFKATMPATAPSDAR